MSDILKKLKRAKAQWRDIEPPKPQNQDLPAGKYEVEISGAELREDKNGGVGILWQFTVLSGAQEGSTQGKWQGVLDNSGSLLPEERIKWVKRDFAILLGEPLEDLDALEEILGDLIGETVPILVKTNKEGYTNVYFSGEASKGDSKKAEKEEEPEDEDEDEDEDEEETPEEDDAEEDVKRLLSRSKVGSKKPRK